MTVVAACRTYLAAQPEVAEVLGSDDIFDMWLFQESLQIPSGTMENTQQNAVVIYLRGGWSDSNIHNTMRFPRLLLEIWSDPPRASDGSYLDLVAAKNQVQLVYEVLDKFMHWSFGGSMMWDETTRINGSQRLGELDLYPVSDGNGLWRGEVYYALNVG